MKIRWYYNTEGGGLYIDQIGELAQVVGPRKKMFLGTNEEIHAKIVAWLATFCGKFYYRTRVSNTDYKELTDADIAINLIRNKREAEIEEHIARRPAGAYDVTHYTESNPYCESLFYVMKNKMTYTTAGSTADIVLNEEIGPLFKKQGYFKIWRNFKHIQCLEPGLAPVPVNIIHYVL